MGRKLTANVWVPDPESGEPVLLEAGAEVPDWAKDLVQNPKVFAHEAEPEAPAEPAASTETVAPIEPSAEPDAPAEPANGRVKRTDYESMDFRELQHEAKARNLSASGTKEELVAKLKADDSGV